MVERAVIDQKKHHPRSFGWAEVEEVLRQTRKLMDVDPIPQIQNIKMSFYPHKRDKWFSFAWWLAH